MHKEKKRKEKEEQHEHFLREAETLATLSHPNVVSIFGVVTDGDRPGIVEEFLSGGSLQRVLAKERERAKDREAARQDAVKKANGDVALQAELLAKVAASTATRSRLDAKTRLQLCLDVARGMEYLHAKRFVHFDLKSDNVLAAVRGRRLVCKVCDFGLSKRRRSQASFVSGVNSRRGTLPWTAPEVLRSPDKVTESADVYSFAIVMWELWTSQLPHYGLDEYALYGGLMMHQLRPTVPGDDALSPRTGPYRAATKDAQVTVDIDPPCDGWETLMKNCWKENSKERPKFVDIVASLEAMKNEHFDGNAFSGTPPVVNKSTGGKSNKQPSPLK
jgi:serine/threonine protein kinase